MRGAIEVLVATMEGPLPGPRTWHQRAVGVEAIRVPVSGQEREQEQEVEQELRWNCASGRAVEAAAPCRLHKSCTHLRTPHCCATIQPIRRALRSSKQCGMVKRCAAFQEAKLLLLQ